MTGQPAETWRKFTFSSAPPYAFWVGGLLLASIMSRRASGYLPLTRASVKKLRTFTLGVVGLIPLGFVLITAGAIVGSNAGNDPIGSSVAFLLFALGIAAIIIALIAILVVRRTYGPTGKVFEEQPGQYQSLIELNNVHPAFVTAVQQLQQMRAQQAYQAPHPFPTKWQ